MSDMRKEKNVNRTETQERNLTPNIDESLVQKRDMRLGVSADRSSRCQQAIEVFTMEKNERAEWFTRKKGLKNEENDCGRKTDSRMSMKRSKPLNAGSMGDSGKRKSGAREWNGERRSPRKRKYFERERELCAWAVGARRGWGTGFERSPINKERENTEEKTREVAAYRKRWQ